MGLAQSWRGCVVRSGAAAGSAGASLPHRPFRAPTWLAPVLLAGLAALPTAAREPVSIATAAAGDGPLPLAVEVGGAVERAMAAGQIPGAVVTIGARGRILFEGAFGARTLAPEREPATLDTLYDLASLTKPIATATGVLILADRGKLELDAPVARYLPEFGARGKQAITVEDLLRHWGGLVADNSLADYRHGPEEAWRRICELELSAPPRAQLLYSDVGYVVLGKLVERLDGRPLERFAREEIFAPLAMGSSGFLPARTSGRAARRRNSAPPRMDPSTGCAARSTTRAPSPWAASRVTRDSSPRRATCRAGVAWCWAGVNWTAGAC